MKEYQNRLEFDIEPVIYLVDVGEGYSLPENNALLYWILSPVITLSCIFQ
jgi:hypothetical protein